MAAPGTKARQDQPLPVQSTVDRRISNRVVVFIVAVILTGFAKNFYLRAWLGTRHLIPTARLHGFTASL